MSKYLGNWWILLMIASLIVSILGLIIANNEFQTINNLNENGLRTTGSWVDRWSTRGINSAASYHVSYEYIVSEVIFTGEVQGRDAYLAFGGSGTPVEVIYDEQDPSVSRLVNIDLKAVQRERSIWLVAVPAITIFWSMFLYLKFKKRG